MHNFENCVKGDCVAVICKFLEPRDIVTLYHMYPKILPKISLAYKRRVAETIDEFFKDTFKDNYEKFKKCMISGNAILSGSLILQKALGETWPGHRSGRIDIDLFVAVKPIYQDKFNYSDTDRKNGFTFYNHDHKFKLGYKKLHHFLHKLRERKNGYNGYVTHSQYMNEFGEQVLLRLNQYVIDKNIFQVVEINNKKFSSWGEFITKTVDFDICKNIFYYNEDDTFELEMGSLPSILNKETTFHYVHDREASIKRREKYVDRGFTFERKNRLNI